MNYLTLRCFSLAGCLCVMTSAWAVMNTEPLTGEAYTLADQAYQAIGRHEDETAEQLIIKARALEPDSYQLAMLLLDTQMRRGEWDAARILSDALLKQLPDDPLLLANSGFIAQFQQRNEAARSYLEAALQHPGLNEVQRNNVSATLASLPAPRSMSMEALSGVAYTLADSAYQALARHDDETAESLVIKASALQPDSYQLAMLLLDIRMRRGKWDDAQKFADDLLTLVPHDASLLADCGFIAQFQQRNDAARGYFEGALKYLGLDSAQRLNVQKALDSLRSHEVQSQPAQVSVVDKRYALLTDAYRWQNEHKDEQALNAFQAAFAIQPGTPEQLASAAYAAKNLQNNKLAIKLFQQALDADRGLPVGRQPFDVQQVFTYRREIQQMNRNWGATVALTYQHNAISSASKLNTLGGGAEIYWQPENFIGNSNGHQFHVFAGVYETLYDAQGGQTGSATAQATVGVRYKPFSSLGMMLVAQRLYPLANQAINDTYLHVGYFDAVGGEINLRQSNWKNWQYYADAGYFVNAKRTYGLFEANYGQAMHVVDVGDRTIFTPHIVLAGEYDSAAMKPLAVSIGPGVKMRYWLREDTYNAPASALEVSLQYRLELTNANRIKGWLMRAMYLY